MINTDSYIVLRPEIKFSSKALQNLCQRWQIVELACFGSVLRDDFHEDSDVDLLVDFAEDAKITFFDLDTIEQEFSELFGDRPVDVVTRGAIENSHNPIRRAKILDHSYIFYHY